MLTQTILVYAILLSAVVYLGYRAYQLVAKKSSKGCEKCASAGVQK